MTTWFTSDPHFGHGNIIKFCNRPYLSVGEMDEGLIANYNKLVKPKDPVYFLGDITWYGSARLNEIMDRLNGEKHLIIGNHDHLKNVKPFFKTVKDYDLIEVNGIRIVMMH